MCRMMVPKLLLLNAETEMPKLVFHSSRINYHNCQNFPKLFSGSSSQNTLNSIVSYAHSYKDYCKAGMFAKITFFLKVILAPSIVGVSERIIIFFEPRSSNLFVGSHMRPIF